MKKYLSMIMNEFAKMKPSVQKINNDILTGNTNRALFNISGLKTEELNQTDANGFTPLHAAARKGDSDAVRKLIEKKVNVNTEDKLGRNSLHHAVLGGDSVSCILLMNNGINIEHKDKKGISPLDIIKEQGMYGLEAQMKATLEKQRLEAYKQKLIAIRKRNLFLASQAC